ncbi:hypothetical protein [Leadbettera azotonutricia]|uniref:Uncharacterized protein n=1 Tax=Leadbettera azotonutricia (strain ATCC BAA-888 / DSM 13862 / ZAS-9) TaxID=545695 RepID=F5YE64_LEAAZ|nr:hypothetical protein [Leadbettera azotonutricia]AEF81473.1 hypothetical protein TREAZ_0263 [Leadbettera azotonutricia ZAS-9]
MATENNETIEDELKYFEVLKSIKNDPQFFSVLAETNVSAQQIIDNISKNHLMSEFEDFIGRLIVDYLEHDYKFYPDFLDLIKSASGGIPLYEKNVKSKKIKSIPNILSIYTPFISLKLKIFTYKQYWDRQTTTLFKYLTWDEKYVTSIIRHPHYIDKKQDYFDKDVLFSFFELGLQLKYSDIKDINFDSIFVRILEMLKFSMNRQKIFMSGYFDIILDYTDHKEDPIHNIGDEITISEPLGRFNYSPSITKPFSRITLFMKNIYDTAKEISVNPHELMEVVYIHELMHFAVIMGIFPIDTSFFEFISDRKNNKQYDDCLYHERYAQYLTYKFIKYPGNLLWVFYELNKIQNPIYLSWKAYEKWDIDLFVRSEILLSPPLPG